MQLQVSLELQFWPASQACDCMDLSVLLIGDKQSCMFRGVISLVMLKARSAIRTNWSLLAKKRFEPILDVPDLQTSCVIFWPRNVVNNVPDLQTSCVSSSGTCDAPLCCPDQSGATPMLADLAGRTIMPSQSLAAACETSTMARAMSTLPF